jgi:hypothetical protein
MMAYGGNPPSGGHIPYIQQGGLAPWAVEAEAKEAAQRRRRRLSPRARRWVEVLALLVVVPVGLGAHWYDDTHTLVPTLNPGEHVTVVPRGGTGTLNHISYRMVGRESAVVPSTLTANGVQATWDVDIKPLDAQGVKAASGLGFRLVDRAGNTWNAAPADLPDYTAGQTVRTRIQGTVPKSEVSGLVLDALGNKYTAVAKKQPRPVLRLAH